MDADKMKWKYFAFIKMTYITSTDVMEPLKVGLKYVMFYYCMYWRVLSR